MRFINYLLSAMIKFVAVLFCFGVIENKDILTSIFWCLFSVVLFMFSDKLLEGRE
jgi:hypothetical protein